MSPSIAPLSYHGPQMKTASLSVGCYEVIKDAIIYVNYIALSLTNDMKYALPIYLSIYLSLFISLGRPACRARAPYILLGET